MNGNNHAPERDSDVVYHIAKSSAWTPSTGVEYAPASLGQDGFIHASTWSQLPAVASRHFRGQQGLLCLEIDVTALSRRPVWEDLYGLGETYPHLYSSVPVEAVCGVLALAWDDEGYPLFRRRGAPLDIAGASLDWKRVEHPDRSSLALLARMNSQLIEDERHDNPAERRTLETRMREFLSGTYRVYLLRIGDLTAGYALVDHGGTPLHVRHYFIQRGLRRLGIGKRALAALTGHLGTRNLTVDVLSSNEQAIRFWHSTGFMDRSVRMVTSRAMPVTGETGDDAGGEGVNSRGKASEAELRIERISGETAIAAAFLKERIRSFNDQVSPRHRHARSIGAVQHLAVMLRDPHGGWHGGVCGSVTWGWLCVDDFWIAPEFREMGHGSRLLEEIESMARSRGATRSQLATFSFQAPGLYERLGYRRVGEMHEYPPGESLIWMQKDL